MGLREIPFNLMLLIPGFNRICCCCLQNRSWRVIYRGRSENELRCVYFGVFVLTPLIVVQV